MYIPGKKHKKDELASGQSGRQAVPFPVFPRDVC